MPDLGLDPVSISVVFSAGFVSCVSPCVLPVIPGYLAFISGVGLEGEGVRRADVAVPTAAFVAGFGAMFTAFGAGAGLVGFSFKSHQRTLEIVGGILVALMGLLLLGRGVPAFLLRERRLHMGNRPTTLAGAFVAGLAFAAGWTPCIGPTLGAALTLAARSGHAGEGAVLLFVYSLGLGVPFLLAGLFLHQATSAMGFLKRRMGLITSLGATLMVVLGVMLATGALTRLTTPLARYAPGL